MANRRRQPRADDKCADSKIIPGDDSGGIGAVLDQSNKSTPVPLGSFCTLPDPRTACAMTILIILHLVGHVPMRGGKSARGTNTYPTILSRGACSGAVGVAEQSRRIGPATLGGELKRRAAHATQLLAGRALLTERMVVRGTGRGNPAGQNEDKSPLVLLAIDLVAR